MKTVNESYLIDDECDNTDILKALTTIAFQMSGIRNDFIFLHVNTFGMSFQTIHEKFDAYYHKLGEDLDTILEIIGMFSSGLYANKFNLNKNRDYECIPKDIVEYSSEDIIDGGREIISKLLNNYDIIRECFKTVNNDGLLSKIDDMANYWIKEYSYLLKRFVC